MYIGLQDKTDHLNINKAASKCQVPFSHKGETDWRGQWERAKRILVHPCGTHKLNRRHSKTKRDSQTFPAA